MQVRTFLLLLTVDWHIIFYLLLESHRVITYMFSLWLILGSSGRGVYLGGTCIYTLLEFQ
jgi:hypothetical protein